MLTSGLLNFRHIRDMAIRRGWAMQASNYGSVVSHGLVVVRFGLVDLK